MLLKITMENIFSLQILGLVVYRALKDTCSKDQKRKRICHFFAQLAAALNDLSDLFQGSIALVNINIQNNKGKVFFRNILFGKK